MFKNFSKLFAKAGIDKAIALTVLSRVIQAAGGIISIFFIARYLSPDEQGYYYTFASIIAIQIFFELGLSGIITQYTAHEFAHLNWENNAVVGEEYYKSRLSSLLRFCIKWFGVISLGLFFILLAAGFIFFNKFNRNLSVEWKAPWVILSLSTALNLFIDPILAYFEGLGEVQDMAQVRLFQKTVTVILLFVFFVLGFKLYSGALDSLIAILINYVQIIFSDRLKKLQVIWKLEKKWKIEYMKEIFPLQWRIALSWISGYFIFQLFNPILFATGGAVVAGQMGMTLQALNGISSISMSWISTKVPLFSSYIAKKEYQILDLTFNKTVKQLSIISFVMLSTFVIFVFGLYLFKLDVSSRFLPLIPLIFLSFITLINQYVFSWATYLRCHKKEPFLYLSLITGLLCALSTCIFGNIWGLMGLVMGYLCISTLVSFPWAFYIFKKSKVLWHQ